MDRKQSVELVEPAHAPTHLSKHDREAQVQQTAERLRQDMALRRSRLNDTLNALTEKLKPANLVEENIKQPIRAKLHDLASQARAGYSATNGYMSHQADTNLGRFALSALGAGLLVGLLVPRRDY